MTVSSTAWLQWGPSMLIQGQNLSQQYFEIRKSKIACIMQVCCLVIQQLLWRKHPVNASASKHADCVVKDKSISVPGPKLLHTTVFTLVAAFVFASVIWGWEEGREEMGGKKKIRESLNCRLSTTKKLPCIFSKHFIFWIVYVEIHVLGSQDMV